MSGRWAYANAAARATAVGRWRFPPPEAYWRGAPWVTVALFAVLGMRLHELLGVPAALQPVLVVSVVGALLLGLNSRQAAVRAVIASRPVRLMITLVIWVFVTAPFALWPGLAVTVAEGTLFSLLLLAACLLCAPTTTNLHRVHVGFVACATAFALATMLFGRLEGGRLGEGTTYDPNDTAAFMAMAFPLAIGLFVRSRGYARWIGLAAVVLLAGVVVASASRGGTVALAVGGLLVVAGYRGVRRMIVVVLFLIGGAVAWSRSGPIFKNRIQSLLSIGSDYNIAYETGRVAVWKRGMGYLVDHPVAGVGAGNFPIAEGEWLAAKSRVGQWSAAHSAYVQAFAELGLVGGLLFVALLVSSAKLALPMWRRPRRSVPAGSLQRPEFLAALCAFGTGAFFLSLLYSYPPFGLIGLIALADRVRRYEAAAAAG